MSLNEMRNYLSPAEISEVFDSGAVMKSTMSLQRFVVYAFLGGAFIAFGGMLSVMVAGGLPGLAAQNPGIVKFIAGAMFPLGLVLVVIAGAGLFTSDCAVLPFAVWKKSLRLLSATKIAIAGYFANFAGALLIAWLFALQTDVFAADPWKSYIVQMSIFKTQHGFWVVFVKGIFANILVCMAVWMAFAAKDVAGKVLVIWIPVMAFVALGMEHSVANMFFIPLGMMLEADVKILDFLWKNLLPSTLGNVAGGLLFVAWPYYYIYQKNLKSNLKPKHINPAVTAPAQQPDMCTTLN
ncbi:MAG: formate/nitrite transporter family protein [Cyclobacteriaceae bacterium]|nr:formate/nitrite transporter family protein [Cyclobacteriaceae bacterium]